MNLFGMHIISPDLREKPLRPVSSGVSSNQ